VFAALVGSLAALVLANRSYSVALGVSLRRSNPALWTVLLVSVSLLGLAMTVPALRSVFRFGEPSAVTLGLAGMASMALLPLLGWIARRRG
jgi:Ca2+-transporting ATPase